MKCLIAVEENLFLIPTVKKNFNVLSQVATHVVNHIEIRVSPQTRVLADCGVCGFGKVSKLDNKVDSHFVDSLCHSTSYDSIHQSNFVNKLQAL